MDTGRTDPIPPRYAISVVRSGGITGERVELSIDTAELTDEAAAELHALIEECRFFERRQTALSRSVRGLFPRPARDIFRYDISIARGDRRKRIVVDDLSIDPALQRLIGRLVTL